MNTLDLTFVDGQTRLNQTVLNGMVSKINELVAAVNDMSGTISAPSINYNSTTHVVTISAGSGLTIRYTTDGSAPTASSGAVYSSAITLSETKTIKAIATDGTRTSSVATLQCVVPPSGEVEVSNVDEITTITHSNYLTESGMTPNAAYDVYKYDISAISNPTRIVVTTSMGSKSSIAIGFNDGNNSRISNIAKGTSPYEYEVQIPSGTATILVTCRVDQGATPTLRLFRNV